MKIGSLVELVNDDWLEVYPHEILPVKNKIYTIRSFIETSVLLEEIINKKELLLNDNGSVIFDEIAFRKKRFRELQPPMKISIEEILKVKI